MDEVIYIIPEWVWGSITVAQEASSESYRDKVMVAEVIIRRTKNKIMSDGTVQGTVLWPFQFSGWNTGDPNRLRVAKYRLDNPKMQECIKAFEEARDKDTNFSNGATHYYAPNPKLKPPFWAKVFEKVAQGDHHIFFKGA